MCSPGDFSLKFANFHGATKLPAGPGPLQKIQEAATELEVALRRGTDTASARDKLAATLTDLVAMLDKAIASPLPETNTAPSLSPDELDHAIANLITLVEAADGQAPSFFLEIRPDLVARLGLEKVGEISNALQHYDYDCALACLRPESAA